MTWTKRRLVNNQTVIKQTQVKPDFSLLDNDVLNMRDHYVLMKLLCNDLRLTIHYLFKQKF